MLAKVDTYQSQTYDCYGIKVLPRGFVNAFQPFIQKGGTVFVGPILELRSEAEKYAEDWAYSLD